MKLTNTPRYKKDYIKFKEMVEQIQKQSSKKEFQKLLNQFELHANQINKGHDPSYNGFIHPQELKENVTEMIRIREKFLQLEKDLDHT